MARSITTPPWIGGQSMASLPPSSQLFQASLTIHSIHLNSCVRRGTVEENSFALKHNTMTRQCLETRTLYQEVSASTIRLYVSHNSLSTEEKCLNRWTVHPVTCHCLITVVEIWLKHKRCGMTFWSHTPGTCLHWKCFPTTAYLLDLRIC